MKLFTLIILTISFSVGYSGMMQGSNYTDPAHPGKCVYGDLILSPGEVGKPKDYCLHVMCGENGEVGFYTCGTTTVDPPCKVGDALYPEELYPRCCEMEIICPEGVKLTGLSVTG